MKRLLGILAFVLIGATAFAQLLPLEHDQSISLPVATDIWDVMPHPSGYYLWCAATSPGSRQTRIYWGRTGVEGYDSLEFNIGAPQSITCFWRGNYEPCVMLSSQNWWRGAIMYDSTLFRIYSLASGLPDSAYWLMCGFRHGNSSEGYDQFDHQPLVVAQKPGPPLITQQVFLMVSYAFHSWSGADVAMYNRYWQSVPNMLTNPSNQLEGIGGLGTFSSWINFEDTLFIAISGWANSLWTPPHEPTRWESPGDVQLFSETDDTLLWMVPGPYGCWGEYWDACSMGSTLLTHDPFTHVSYCLAQTRWFTGIVTYPQHGNGSPVWTVSIPYNFWLSAEVVSGNETEEFLAYDSTRNVFDVFNAENGRNYGVTDTIRISTSGARIISRYDSASLRLAYRDSSQIRLYRFGEYLSAEHRSISIPAAFALSVYPNPFNPSTTITFSLTGEKEFNLRIYDIAGREVVVLADGRYAAGDHRVMFDGADLPSGIYFAAARAGTLRAVKKLMLLR